MKRIIGVGNALVDVVCRIEGDELLGSLGLPKGSMQLVDIKKSALIREKTKGSNISYSAGGSNANAIHGLGKLGIGAGFIGSIGTDDMGDYFENDMKQAGVATYLLRSWSPTGTSTVLVSSDSERTMATHLGAAVEITADSILEGYFKGYDILYFEGYLVPNRPLIEKMCQLAKNLGMEVAIDMASYNIVEENLGFYGDIVDKYVDILFANEEEARSFTNLSADDAVAELSKRCKIVVIKTGKRGSLIKSGDEFLKIGSLDVMCVDTTGAGDLYSSGFLYGYSKGMGLEKCGLLGTLLAGNIIQVVGSKMDDRRWDNIKTALKEIEELE